MKTTTDFACNVEKFLTRYLPFQRNYSLNTISSYKDGIKLFVRFVIEEKGYDINKFTMADFTKELIIEYLGYLRRTCTINTANQRLSALKSFASFCQAESIECISSLQSVINIKNTKHTKKVIDILDEDATKALINLPDTRTLMGLKHRTLLSILYETGCRAQELCDIKINDLNLNKHSTLYLHGKGNKDRIVPISDDLSKLIKIYIDKTYSSRHSDDIYLFLNKDKAKMHIDGVDYILKKYFDILKIRNELKLPDKIHPHTMRHSRASHLIAAGIPAIYVRDFLGHEDVKTTQIYVKLDQRLKEESINKLGPKILEQVDDLPDWTNDKSLMDFLNKFN